MGIEWFEVEGEVEVLGDSQILPKGRTYATVKIRDESGRLLSFEGFHALPRVNAMLNLGQHVRLLGYRWRGRHQAVAAITSDERVDDLDLLMAGARYLRFMRLFTLGLFASPFLLAWMNGPYGAPIAALIAWPMAALVWFAGGRFASVNPSDNELRARVAEFVARQSRA